MKIEYLSSEDFRDVAKHAKSSIVWGIVKGFPDVASKYKVKPVHAALVFGQIGVESDHYKTMEEYASGNAYDTRTDLGNTPEVDGDGALNKGAGLIQRTGHTNLTKSARRYNLSMPEIRKALKTDPVLAIDDAFHYCMVERGRQMADCVKSEDIKILTKAVNGGYTHHGERVRYTRLFMLILLDYDTTPEGILNFQEDSSAYIGELDGQMGPKTEAALWKMIKKASWKYPTGQSLGQKLTEKETAINTTISVAVGGGIVGAFYSFWGYIQNFWQWIIGG